MPPSLLGYAGNNIGAGQALPRANTATAQTPCSVVILDTLGWLSEGGLDTTLGAQGVVGLAPLECFFLRYVACEAESTGCCKPKALEELDKDVSKGEKPNPWVLAWEDPEGKDVPLSVVTKMCRGMPNKYAVRAVTKLPGMLQELLSPFR